MTQRPTWRLPTPQIRSYSDIVCIIRLRIIIIIIIIKYLDEENILLTYLLTLWKSDVLLIVKSFYYICFAETMFDDVKLSLSEYIQAAEIYAKVTSACCLPVS